MKDNIKIAKRGLNISVVAVVISSINLIYSSIKGSSLFMPITMFCSTIAIFCANISNYKSKKNNYNNVIGQAICQ